MRRRWFNRVDSIATVERHSLFKDDTTESIFTMAETLEEFRARLNGAATSTYILVMLVVPLKLWCRVTVAGWKGFGLDDYLCVLALACANVFFYICMCGKYPFSHVNMLATRNTIWKARD